MKAGELAKALIRNDQSADGGDQGSIVETNAPCEPFPALSLPEPLRTFVLAGADTMNCPIELVTLPTLTICAAAIGTTRCIELRPGWREPTTIWSATVLRSSGLKTPALEYGTEVLQRAQDDQFREYEHLCEEHERAMLRYEIDLKSWKERKKKEPRCGDPPTQPPEPMAVRYIVEDCTIEALAPILRDNPRGIVVLRDELAGFFRSFNQYKGGRGSDLPNWLQLHRLGRITVDRRHGVPRTIRVQGATASICGTIQPGTLRRVLTPEYFESGLASRFLLVEPPPRRKRWHRRLVDPQVLGAYTDLVTQLLALEHARNRQGDPVPINMPMTSEGEALWEPFYNTFADQQFDAESDDLAAAFGKIEAYASRFALIFELVASAARGVACDAVGAEAMQSGIVLAKWFANETERIYGRLAMSEEDRERQQLTDYIRAHGGAISVRDLQRGRRRYGNHDAAQSALDELVSLGLGTWRDIRPADANGNTRGRPTRVLQLSGAVDGDNNPIEGT